MSYAKVIINPFARGGRTGKWWPRISKLLKDAGLSFDHSFTEGVGHGIELAKEAADKCYELVIAVGGDGTVNEVINGLVDEGGKGRAMLGIISTGTGGDVVRTLGIPSHYADACRLLANPKRLTIDLGVVEYVSDNRGIRRFYINTAGLGLDAAVVKRTRRFTIKRYTIIPFVLGFLATIITYHGRNVVLNIDGEKWQERVFLIVVNNGCYFGGRMKIVPDADPRDGLLDVVTVADMGKIRLLWNFPRLYRGTHVTHPMVMVCRARNIEVEAEERMLLQVDGELVGEAPANFSVLPAALTVAVG